MRKSAPNFAPRYSQVFAIGPAVHLTFLKYASAEIRWAKEFDVENRPEGDMLWAKLTIPFEL